MSKKSNKEKQQTQEIIIDSDGDEKIDFVEPEIPMDFSTMTAEEERCFSFCFNLCKMPLWSAKYAVYQLRLRNEAKQRREAKA